MIDASSDRGTPPGDTEPSGAHRAGDASDSGDARRDGTGTVWLVGAGPGDPELLTVRAHRLITAASIVAYDELVSPEILGLAPRDAELVPVGRRGGGCRHHDAKIHPRVVELALAGRDVVRLKGGDPFVFGRGGEEAEELAAAGIAFGVVPGISAALGAAASLHVPLTHRACASSVTFATGHAAEPPPGGGARSSGPDGEPSAPSRGTYVFYMGIAQLEERVAELVRAGFRPSTPAAVVASATTPRERSVVGTLETIAPLVRAADLRPPALVIVGEVVARRVASPAPRSAPIPPLDLDRALDHAAE